MPNERPPDRPGGEPREDDPWADEPDRWAEADRAWEQKWDDEAAADAEAAFVEPLPTGAGLAAGPHAGPSPMHAYHEGMRAAGPSLSLGPQIAFSMLFFVGAGYGLDRWLESSPWGLIGGAVLGMVAVFAFVIRLANEANRRGRR